MTDEYMEHNFPLTTALLADFAAEDAWSNLSEHVKQSNLAPWHEYTEYLALEDDRREYTLGIPSIFWA